MNNLNHFNDSNDQFKIIGLPNFGNTCYVNSAIQIFLRCTAIVNKIKQYNSNNSNNIISILKNIIEAYESFNYNLFESNIRTLLQNYTKMQNIGINDQCDASLFLNFIFSELSDIKNQEINSYFKLLFCNIITCKCNNSLLKYQNENFLNVYPNEPIQQLDKLIGKQLTRSNLVDYKCDKCKINNLDSDSPITDHSILVNTGKYFFINISKIINYNSQIIPMDTFTITTPNNIENRIKDHIIDDKLNTFNIIGFIVHLGSASLISSGGHYVSCLKYENDWYLCNDLQVTKINNNDINNLINRATFLLYNKI